MGPAFHNVFLLVATKVLGTLIYAGFVATVARFTEPEDRALIALATFGVGVGLQFVDLSIDPALIHFGLSENWISSHAALRALGAIILLGLAFTFFWAEPDLGPANFRHALLFLAISESMRLCYLTPKTILEMSNRLGSLAIAEFISLIVGCGAGVLLALNGGTWSSIALQLLVTNSLQLSIVLYLVRNELSLTIHVPSVKIMLYRFGVPLWLASSVGWLLKLDVPFLGKWGTTEELGFYSMAFGIVLIFGPNLSGLLSRILLPIYGRRKHNRASVRMIFEETLAIKLWVILPLFAMVIASSSWWFGFLFGDDWSGALLPFQVLTLFMWLRLMYDDQGPIMSILDGRPELYFRVHGLYGVSFLGLALPLVWLGGLAGMLGALVISTTLASYLATRINADSLQARMRHGYVIPFALLVWTTVMIGVDFAELLFPTAENVLRILTIIISALSVVIYCRRSDYIGKGEGLIGPSLRSLRQQLEAL